MTLKNKIETVLFVSAKAMNVADIAEILKEDADKIEENLLALLMDYASRDGALEIDDEDGYIIQVKEDYKSIVEKLVPVEMRPAVLKTLSVIAIKEPIRQSHLKELRSSAYEHIQELLTKGLISRKKDKNGRSFNIKTTDKFSEYFKLKGDTKALARVLDLEGRIKDKPAKPEVDNDINEEDIVD